MAAPKDPITCHVLDTTTGRPAPNIAVTLSYEGDSNPSKFQASTDLDGRISKWEAVEPLAQRMTTSQQMDHLITSAETKAQTTVWKLRFDTGSYYGADKTFWPEVILTFTVKPGEHYHVPLLLGPYSYTTYRGS